jgi:hypothetical protein
MSKIRITPELVARFFAKIEVGARHQCWPYLGLRNRKGYGQFCVTIAPKQDEMLPATHIALEIAGQPRPAGLWALHHCDNPPCCNPTHLYWGTVKQNVTDMFARGRVSRKGRTGERNNAAKLTTEQVLYVRSSPLGATAIARELGVSHSLIHNIRARKIWTHI